MRVNIDDRNTTLIAYDGQWDELPGSTRQWEGGVHSTGAAGATATFRFRGLQVWVWGTIPAGTDSKTTIDIKIDNEDTVTQVRTSNGSAVYAEVFFQSPLLRETYHTIVITNKVPTTAGANEFMLDRLEFETNDQVPLFAPAGTSPTGGTTPTGKTPEGQIASSSGSKPPIAAILGAVVGVFAVIIVILGIILWRRRRSEKPKEVEVPNTEEVTSGGGTRRRITFNLNRSSNQRGSTTAETTSQVVPFSPDPIRDSIDPTLQRSAPDTPGSLPSPQRPYYGKAAMMEEARLASRPSIATDLSQTQSQGQSSGSVAGAGAGTGTGPTISSPGTNEVSSLYTSDAQSPLVQPQPTLPQDAGLLPPPPYDLNPRQ